MSIKDYKTPTDQQAEIAVLSAMLNSEQCLDDALSSIDENYFYYDETKKAFKVIVSLSTDTQPNVQSVLKRMETQREKTLIKRADMSFKGVEAFSAALKDLADTYLKREQYYTAMKILGMTQDTNSHPEEILSVMDAGMSKVFSSDAKDEIIEPEVYATEALEHFREVCQAPEEAYGIRLSIELPNGQVIGFPGIDETILGLHGGDLIFIAAQTGKGKTAVAQNIARIVSIHQKYRTYYENTEMRKLEMAARLAAQLSQVPAKEIMSGRLTGTAQEIQAKKQKVEKAYQKIRDSQLYLSRLPNLTVAKSRGLAKKFRNKYGSLDMLVIDYVGRMNLDTPEFSKLQDYQKLIRVAKKSKELAMELNAPVVLLGQLNDDEQIEGAKAMANECDAVYFFKPLNSKDEDLLRKSFRDEEKAKRVTHKIEKRKVRRDDSDIPIWCHFDKKRQFITEVVPEIRG
ncbi:replicative DNA helicase [Aneurinibacillus soli]|uniref:DNA 5'-3' helicase n=1 Tax=Aneurinibacillus soli TaxID=1500254 RepID=A0A0U5BDB9_9BACL|nr:DnaB-like helicase C-terminal domain-containing protein [Aneurinibacillus soli]PYE64250.1 replicative DNA helicase [Aneurinibacillus soli]BAU28199.1 Replicative DNA helicase [Aneurinibacillus soli]